MFLGSQVCGPQTCEPKFLSNMWIRLHDLVSFRLLNKVNKKANPSVKDKLAFVRLLIHLFFCSCIYICVNYFSVFNGNIFCIHIFIF